MKPENREIVESVVWSLDTYISPELSSSFARSVLKTAKNLIRHVGLRAEREFSIVYGDVEDLEQTLTMCMNYLTKTPAVTELFDAELEELNKALRNGRLEIDKDYFLKLKKRLFWLQGILDKTVKILNKFDMDLAEDSDFKKIRKSVREYFSRKLERDSQVIGEAFVGGRR